MPPLSVTSAGASPARSHGPGNGKRIKSDERPIVKAGDRI